MADTNTKHTPGLCGNCTDRECCADRVICTHCERVISRLIDALEMCRDGLEDARGMARAFKHDERSSAYSRRIKLATAAITHAEGKDPTR